MKHLIGTLGPVLMAAMLLGRPAWAAEMQYSDQIKPTNGQLIICTIVDEDVDRITFINKESTVRQTIDNDKVEYYRYSDKTRRLRDADEDFKNGDYGKAIPAYRKALLNPNIRPFWSHPHCYYHLAEAYRQLGQLTEAEEALDNLKSKYPNSRYKAEGLNAQGDIFFQNQKYEKAGKTFQEIENSPRFSARERDKAAMGAAKCLRELTHYDQAVRKLKQVQANAAARGDLELMSKAAAEIIVVYSRTNIVKASSEAKMLIEQFKRKYNEGIAGATNSVKANRGLRRAIAMCYNVLGDAHFESKEEDHLMNALVSYMWVVAIFNDSPEERARALYMAGRCRRELGGDENEIKAQALWKELRQEYGQSPWVSKIPK